MPTVLVVGTDPAATTVTWHCLVFPSCPIINDISKLSSRHRALSDMTWIWLYFNELRSPYDIGIRDTRLLFRQPFRQQLLSISTNPGRLALFLLFSS